QLIVSEENASRARFQFFSCSGGERRKESTWRLHASGTMRPTAAWSSTLGTMPCSLDSITETCADVLTKSEHYDEMRQLGIELGPGFQAVNQVWRRRGQAIGELRAIPNSHVGDAPHELHPSIIDAGFQILASAIAGSRPYSYSAPY